MKTWFARKIGTKNVGMTTSGSVSTGCPPGGDEGACCERRDDEGEDNELGSREGEPSEEAGGAREQGEAEPDSGRDDRGAGKTRHRDIGSGHGKVLSEGWFTQVSIMCIY